MVQTTIKTEKMSLTRIKKFFAPTTVTKKIYKNFINTGEVPPEIIHTLAMKIILLREMTMDEKCIFYSKTAEINEMIIKLKENS